MARLMAMRRPRSVIALSAVVENGRELADWLQVPLLEGSPEDRPVSLELECRMVDDLDDGLPRSLEPFCRDRAQAIVFCSSRRGAEKAAQALATHLAGALALDERASVEEQAVNLVMEEDQAAQEIAEVLPSGVAYHHAGLSGEVRRQVEECFRKGRLRVLTATPTLAAGVNLPAEITVVRDVFRAEAMRGSFRHVLLPSGELLNMLGRAARPGLAERGKGIVLVEGRYRNDRDVKELVANVEAGRGGTVRSRLPESFEAMMRFVLATVVETGETSRQGMARAFEHTFAYHREPQPIRFDRSLREDLMEDIPSYRKVAASGGSIRLEGYEVTPSGVHARVASGDHAYTVTLTVTGLSCTCPAASQYYRGQVCKHQACATSSVRRWIWARGYLWRWRSWRTGGWWSGSRAAGGRRRSGSSPPPPASISFWCAGRSSASSGRRAPPTGK